MIIVLFKLFIFVIYIIKRSYTVYISPYVNITPPSHPDQRVAIILSGQLRSGNLTWFSGDIRVDKGRNMFGGDDPQTPIGTVLEFLIKPYALYGGVDMFVFIQVDLKQKTNPSSNNQTGSSRNDILSSYSTLYCNNVIFIVWDGNPAHYEHTLGDMRMCELYSQDPIFSPHTGNKVFCSTVYEKQVSNQFVESYSFWKGQLAKEILLQQLYGLYRANMACKQYSLASNVKYKYKIRLRPDLAVVKPFPPLTSINFNGTNPSCKETIYYPNNVIFPQGAEDSFNIGYAESMDYLLDRYVDLTTKPFIFRPWRGHHYWNSESYLQALIEERYHLCFNTCNDIWMVVIRKADHQTHYEKPSVPGDNIWVIMNHTTNR